MGGGAGGSMSGKLEATDSERLVANSSFYSHYIFKQQGVMRESAGVSLFNSLLTTIYCASKIHLYEGLIISIVYEHEYTMA